MARLGQLTLGVGVGTGGGQRSGELRQLLTLGDVLGEQPGGGFGVHGRQVRRPKGGRQARP
jgi:hypothetical protein